MALNFLQEGNVLDLLPSRIELDGDKVFAMIQHYDTKPKSKEFGRRIASISIFNMWQRGKS